MCSSWTTAIMATSGCVVILVNTSLDNSS
jgi:hypothetical protein